MRSLEVVRTVLRYSLFATYSSLLFLASFKAAACGQGTSSSKIVGLPTLGGSGVQPNSMNATGQITGFSYTAGDLASHAFLYGSGAMVDLGTFGGGKSEGLAINAAGQVVGDADLGGNQTHAFLYDGVNLIDLGTLGGSYSSAAGINDAGVIVGGSLLAGDAQVAAFAYIGGSMTNLGDLGG